jgi:hypothetical protein
MSKSLYRLPYYDRGFATLNYIFDFGMSLKSYLTKDSKPYMNFYSYVFYLLNLSPGRSGSTNCMYLAVGTIRTNYILSPYLYDSGFQMLWMYMRSTL